MKISTKKYIKNQTDWIEKLYNAELTSVRRKIEALRQADKDASDKLEKTTTAKFESQNEWRAQMKDQTGTFMTRREIWGIAVAVITILLTIAGLIILL